MLACRHAIRNLQTNIPVADTENILQYLNNAAEDDLLSWKSFSKQQVDNISFHLEQKSEFRNLSDVLLVKGLGKKSLRRFTAEYLGRDEDELWPDENSKPAYKIQRNIINPRYVTSEVPDSIVSCGVQLDFICWVKLNKNLDLLEWNYTTLNSYMRRKYDHVLYQRTFWSLMKEIPRAEVYLLEDSLIHASTVSTFPGALNKGRLDATLTSFLNLRENNDVNAPFQHKVHKFKHAEVGRHYNLIVGGEKVSSQKVALDFIKGHKSIAGEYVSASRELLMNYYESKSAVKEQMCNAFLHACMFYEMLLEQDNSDEES